VHGAGDTFHPVCWWDVRSSVAPLNYLWTATKLHGRDGQNEPLRCNDSGPPRLSSDHV
jgi:hypothetical protein